MNALDKPGRKIETIEHRNGTSAILYFNQRSMMFTVTVGPDTKRAKDGDEVRRWARVMLGKSTKLAWVPVAEVTPKENAFGRSSSDLSADFELEVDRFFLAETPGGKLLKLEWEKGDPASTGYVEDQDDRLDSAEAFRFDGRTHYFDREDKDLKPERLKLPRTNGSHHFLAYTPGLWAGLVAMIEQVRQVNRACRALLGSKAGLEEIERVGRERTPLQLTAITGDADAEG